MKLSVHFFAIKETNQRKHPRIAVNFLINHLKKAQSKIFFFIVFKTTSWAQL